MGIDATSSSVTTAASTQSSPTTSVASAKSSSSDASFKDEISKVSEKENKDVKSSDNDKNTKADKKLEAKSDKKELSSVKQDKKQQSYIEDNSKMKEYVMNAQLSMNNANMMLTNDIQQMIESTATSNAINSKNWTIGLGNGETSNLKMTESDADFFITLTQSENVNLASVQAQAQNMVNNGADVSDIKQNVQVSQTLLNALSEARENNQPIRIDFDQNISVILRVGRDGAISAQFIPGDKAVEQYLRNNIDSLKSSFDEQDLPYSELSYSNSSKEQNQRRREEKRQGE